jgi:hypothetical protein
MTGHVTERMTEHYSHVDANEKRTAVVRALAPLSAAQVGTEVGTSAAATNHAASTAPLSALKLS